MMIMVVMMLLGQGRVEEIEREPEEIGDEVIERVASSECLS
jgi:hypothetical protein